MASILTNLRELSVGFSLFYSNPTEDITPAIFRYICENHVINFDAKTQISSTADAFNDRELQTIANGIILGKKLKDILHLDDGDLVVEWIGNIKDDLIDIRINGINISLKENSFVLKNMGLYALLNLLTNTQNFRRGLHIFQQFAPDEFERWFRSALSCLSAEPDFEYNSNHGYIARGRIKERNLILSLNSETVMIPDYKNITYTDFMNLTDARIREKAFCKWLSRTTSDEYFKQKRACALAAGNRLQDYINKNIVRMSPSVLSLFNLEKNEYIYAKNDGNILQIAKVPGLDTVDYTNWTIENVEVSVPNSQLNLKTTVKNTKTGKSCTFRNEIRYSHGQFNGTPEAKLYIDSESNLEELIYESLL